MPCRFCPSSILCVCVCVNSQLVPARERGSHDGIYCRLASTSLCLLTFLTSPWGSYSSHSVVASSLVFMKPLNMTLLIKSLTWLLYDQQKNPGNEAIPAADCMKERAKSQEPCLYIKHYLTIKAPPAGPASPSQTGGPLPLTLPEQLENKARFCSCPLQALQYSPEQLIVAILLPA